MEKTQGGDVRFLIFAPVSSCRVFTCIVQLLKLPLKMHFKYEDFQE